VHSQQCTPKLHDLIVLWRNDFKLAFRFALQKGENGFAKFNVAGNFVLESGSERRHIADLLEKSILHEQRERRPTPDSCMAALTVSRGEKRFGTRTIPRNAYTHATFERYHPAIPSSCISLESGSTVASGPARRRTH
jgi:hypothetical protein